MIRWIKEKLQQFRAAREETDRLRSKNVEAIAHASPEQLDQVSVRLDQISIKKGDSKTLKRVVLPALVLCLALAGGGCCGGLGSKTAKDIETASEMILPEYLSYVDADPKLKDDQKQDRRNQVRALRDVIKAAQK